MSKKASCGDAAEHAVYAPTPATQARRKDRMTYDKAAIHAVLDEGFVCHAAYADEAGQARVHPTNYWRIGEAIYLHGGHKSGLMKAIARGERLSIAVTLEDGLVLAKSAFAHSMNYRCVMLYGRGRLLSDEEKYAVIPPFIDKVAPGRSALVRPGKRKGSSGDSHRRGAAGGSGDEESLRPARRSWPGPGLASVDRGGAGAVSVNRERLSHQCERSRALPPHHHRGHHSVDDCARSCVGQFSDEADEPAIGQAAGWFASPDCHSALQLLVRSHGREPADLIHSRGSHALAAGQEAIHQHPHE